MKIIATCALLATLCVSTRTAEAQSIGIYFSLDTMACSTTQPANSPGVAYVVAFGGAPTWITGAEFRVDGFPGGWIADVVWNANSNVQVGSPLSGGVSLGFPSCQTGGDPVLLCRIDYFATTFESNVLLEIVERSVPSDPGFSCPLITLCDAPAYTMLCVAGGVAIINGGPCTVDVKSRTMSEVRMLYR